MATSKTQLKRQALLQICMEVFLKSRLAPACTGNSDQTHKGNPYTSLYGIPSQLCGIVWPHRQPIKAHRHATKPWRRHALICFLKSRLSPACRWGFQCKAAVGNMHNPTVALHRCGLYMLWKVAGLQPCATSNRRSLTEYSWGDVIYKLG